jgi:predicted Fe-Mo cluster-binding NifX family protein
MVSGHFGHCEHFVMYDVQDNKVTNKESLPNPGHKPGFLPNFLHEKGANVIISGGMGGGAVDIFNGHNIEVIVGAVGETDTLIDQYIKGELKSTGSVCHQHDHADECH